MRAIKAQEGPTAAAVRVQTAAMREPLYHPAALGCALSGVLATNRPPRHVQRSLAARGRPVSYTHLRAHETVLDLVCRLLLEKKK